MNYVLQVKQLNKTIGKKKILNNISFDVQSSEIFGFLGPNGAGKTTTIKIIMGLLKLNSGEILINGNNIRNNFEKAISNVGGIIENPEMYKHLSGLDNLKLASRLYKNVDEKRINEVIKLVGLQNRINDKVRGYSLGMRQRLGLAQSILHKPKLLILDEPTNGLDPAGIHELREMLKLLAKNEGMSVLVSSHILSEMEMMCDKFCIIDNGIIVDIRNISDISQSKNTISKYKIEVDNIELSQKTLANNNFDNIEIENNFISLSISKNDVSKLIKLFIQDGINIYEFSQLKNSLEEEFLNITSKSEIK